MGRKTKFSSEVLEISKKLAKEGCTDEFQQVVDLYLRCFSIIHKVLWGEEKSVL